MIYLSFECAGKVYDILLELFCLDPPIHLLEILCSYFIFVFDLKNADCMLFVLLHLDSHLFRNHMKNSQVLIHFLLCFGRNLLTL